MSDAIRSYRSPSKIAPSGSRSLLRGSFRLTRYLFFLLLVIGIYVFWISRDTRRVEEFVPADTTFHIIAQNLVENHDQFHKTDVWNTLPEEWRSHPFPKLLQSRVGLPDWAQRNLLGQYVFISGTDFAEFSDTVYITKFSRVGSILERILRWSDGNEGDAAGGLNIRTLPEHELFYAIRGRVALLSSSRRALIHSLTLEEAERLSASDWDESIWQRGGEDLSGTVDLTGDSQWSKYFSAAGFALRLDQDQGVLKLSLSCTDEFYGTFGEKLRNTPARKLFSPTAGSIRISADMGTTASELWNTVGKLAGDESSYFARWDDWTDNSDQETLESLLANTLGNTGPGIALTWHGIDMDTILPAPQFSLMAQVNDDSVRKKLVAHSERGNVNGFTQVETQTNEEQGWTEIVSIGGPARTAVLLPSGNGNHVYASTSKLRAESFNANSVQSPKFMQENANLFVSISPTEVLADYIKYGKEMAANGLLAGYSAKEFTIHAQELTAKYAGIQEVRLVARHDQGMVLADITLKSVAK
jgi:hypothetical protein